MKHYPPTLSRTLELIERRRLYTLHMSNLNPVHGGTETSPFDPIPAVVHRDEKKKYYRDLELRLRKGEHARIKRPSSKKYQSTYNYRRTTVKNYTANGHIDESNNTSTSKGNLNSTQKSVNNNTNNDTLASNNFDNDEQISESAEEVLERLVHESGMRVLDRSLSSRSPRKNKPILYTIQSTTPKNSNYVNNQTQTLKSDQQLTPQPPEQENDRDTPRKYRTRSQIDDNESIDDIDLEEEIKNREAEILENAIKNENDEKDKNQEEKNETYEKGKSNEEDNKETNEEEDKDNDDENEKNKSDEESNKKEEEDKNENENDENGDKNEDNKSEDDDEKEKEKEEGD